MLNVFTGIGRCGKDAVVRQTSGGRSVTGWSVAIDAGFGDNKTTTWLDCSLWGDRGPKIAEFIRKGDRIGVSGEIATREHEGKVYVTLNVREVTLLGDKAGARETPQTGKPVDPEGFNDDIGF